MINSKEAVKAMQQMAKMHYRIALDCRDLDIQYGHAVSIDELSAIAELAQSGGVPDGTFSDAACEAWCIIRRSMGG